MEPIIYKQGDTLQKSIRATDADGQSINWTSVSTVELAFVNYAGVQVALFTMDSGLAINPSDDEALVLTIPPDLNILPSFYRYDVKMILSPGIVKHSPTGDVQVLQSVTQ